MFKLLVSAVSSALLLSSVSASPIVKRDDVTCKFVTAAFLTLQTKLQQPGGTGGSDYIFVGLSDPDSNTGSRHLTSKDPSGGKSLNSNFAFYSCDSKFMGYETVEGNGDGAFGQNSITNYGHIALETKGHNPKHCLTYGSNPEDPTLISHDYCSFKDDESQTANFFSYVEHTTDAAVYLGGPKGESKDYYITLSDDGVVHLNPGKAPEGTQEYFLGLPQFVD